MKTNFVFLNLLSIFGYAFAGGTLSLKFIRYQNENPDGINCCKSYFSYLLCPLQQCDPYFDICIDEISRTNCSVFYGITNKWKKNDTVIFREKIGSMNNPLIFHFDVWKGGFRVRIHSYDKRILSLNGNQRDKGSDLTIHITKQPTANGSTAVEMAQITGENARWDIEYTVACDDSFYQDCNKHCRTDGKHYTCDIQGNRVCLPGWTGITCYTAVQNCSDNPCLNVGSCEDRDSSYICHCDQFFTGTHCEVSLITQPPRQRLLKPLRPMFESSLKNASPTNLELQSQENINTFLIEGVEEPMITSQVINIHNEEGGKNVFSGSITEDNSLSASVSKQETTKYDDNHKKNTTKGRETEATAFENVDTTESISDVKQNNTNIGTGLTSTISDITDALSEISNLPSISTTEIPVEQETTKIVSNAETTMSLLLENLQSAEIMGITNKIHSTGRENELSSFNTDREIYQSTLDHEYFSRDGYESENHISSDSQTFTIGTRDITSQSNISYSKATDLINPSSREFQEERQSTGELIVSTENPTTPYFGVNIDTVSTTSNKKEGNSQGIVTTQYKYSNTDTYLPTSDVYSPSKTEELSQTSTEVTSAVSTDNVYTSSDTSIVSDHILSNGKSDPTQKHHEWSTVSFQTEYSDNPTKTNTYTELSQTINAMITTSTNLQLNTMGNPITNSYSSEYLSSSEANKEAIKNTASAAFDRSMTTEQLTLSTEQYETRSRYISDKYPETTTVHNTTIDNTYEKEKTTGVSGLGSSSDRDLTDSSKDSTQIYQTFTFPWTIVKTDGKDAYTNTEIIATTEIPSQYITYTTNNANKTENVSIPTTELKSSSVHKANPTTGVLTDSSIDSSMLTNTIIDTDLATISTPNKSYNTSNNSASVPLTSTNSVFTSPNIRSTTVTNLICKSSVFVDSKGDAYLRLTYVRDSNQTIKLILEMLEKDGYEEKNLRVESIYHGKNGTAVLKIKIWNDNIPLEEKLLRRISSKVCSRSPYSLSNLTKVDINGGLSDGGLIGLLVGLLYLTFIFIIAVILVRRKYKEGNKVSSTGELNHSEDNKINLDIKEYGGSVC